MSRVTLHKTVTFVIWANSIRLLQALALHNVLLALLHYVSMVALHYVAKLKTVLRKNFNR
ncbi:hypothetical protein H6G17_05830 [Chroococcidiopsis sp. FACHB-1243]|uniref:hypothetical protein n=1 Tax=Chroococcidiopsis sp. [FACHB-1243] TaxID=2692781 RepID=UPI001786F328|nr:hypothetical protein [Chroococcidiopsis sp. [FACHB-1243]]MBD2305034.1 hypothetical protein [Chroococcidiopsis sp. [FACHB-1243]]